MQQAFRMSERMRRNNAFKYIVFKKKRPDNAFWRLFRRFVYDWDANYRFTSRFINTILVGLVALYYFFLFVLYFVGITVTKFANQINTVASVLEVGSITINLGDIGNLIGDIDALAAFGSITIPLPKDKYRIDFDLRASINCVFILPTFSALLITLIHVGLLMRETKENLRLLAKGKCEFVRSAEYIGNPKIAASSFHFGGWV